MEKQNDIVLKTLRIMSSAGILDRVLLIGSWCAYFYKRYFSKVEYNPVIKTRDIDFLVSARPKFPKKVDLEELLKPLGFEVEFVTIQVLGDILPCLSFPRRRESRTH